MKFKRQVLLALALLLSVPVLAQDDETLYMQQAGGAALLYRGHKAFSYPMAYNGTYFWDGPSFKKGDVYYNGKLYEDLTMNVDASRQDLLIKTLSGGAEKVLARGYVEWFTLDGKRFVNLQQTYSADAPDGYWEVLYDGKAKLLKQVVRRLQQDVSGNLRSEMGYDDPNYRSNVYNIFICQLRYCYISEDGKIVPVRRRSQLMQFYKDKKREIKRRITALESRGMLDFDTYCSSVIQFAESL